MAEDDAHLVKQLDWKVTQMQGHHESSFATQDSLVTSMFSLQFMGHMCPKIAMNTGQHFIVDKIKLQCQKS